MIINKCVMNQVNLSQVRRKVRSDGTQISSCTVANGGAAFNTNALLNNEFVSDTQMLSQNGTQHDQSYASQPTQIIFDEVLIRDDYF